MMKKNELEAARTFILNNLPAESRVLCAVSGGPDSMCLLHFMHTWGRANGFCTAAAHFNHQLRETADRDEAFVRQYCKEEQIPFFSGSGDVQRLAAEAGLSAEEAARKLRYDFLRRTAEAAGCQAIFTAHHADDNAETVLLNLIRGTGLKGLTGIPACRDRIYRPFLAITRQELTHYAAAHKIPYVEDETNLDADAAARNLLRLQVMPLLQKLNPRAAEHICEAAGRLEAADRMLDEEAARRTARAEAGEGRVAVVMPPEEWKQIPEPIRSRVLLQLLDLLGTGRKDIGSVHLEALEGLIRGNCGQLDLPHGITARRERNRLILKTAAEPLSEEELTPNSPLCWGDYTLILLDRPEGEGLALLSECKGEKITVAPCRPGARLTLPGAAGSRSVKRLCLDRRIGIPERDRLPAVYVGGCLAAVWPLGTDQKFAGAGKDPDCFIKIIHNTREKRHED